MANPIPTDHATVLQAVVDRLIDQLPDLGFSERTCFLAPDREIIEPNRSGKICCTVTSMDSQFGDEALTGGAENVCIEHSGVVVTPHTAIKLDAVERLDAVLKDTTRGLLVMKKRILKALTGHRLQDPDGNELLVNLPHPLHASRTAYNSVTGLAWLSVTFSTDFEWALVDPIED